MTCYESIEKNIRERMVQGEMHRTLRDIGRRAGGYLAGGSLTQGEADSLGKLAESMSINHAEGRRKWAEAVEFGRRSPLHWDEAPRTRGVALTWDSGISEDALKIVRDEWLEDVVLDEPDKSDWDPCSILTEYLSLMFRPDEIVGYCIRPFEKAGRFIPSNGTYDRTAGEIEKKLRKGRFDEAVGTPDEEHGGWIRINPLDGKGTRDVNVTDFRHALIEADGVSVEKQIAIYRKLELPCTCIVHSGGKSAHAIVKVEAKDLDEYHRRVDFLFEVCKKNGLDVDRQNRNPSRYSRMPGLMRAGKKQYIIERGCGKKSWSEWEEWIGEQNDDLPEFEGLCDADKLPPLKPEQIEGVLRAGHKMILSGPSKAGKSFALMQLAIAIAEGGEWFGHKCMPGSVLYVNLELDDASCQHRFSAIYGAMGIKSEHRDMIRVWNLRGRAMPLDALAPKLIRRAKKVGFSMIILDPIYQVLTGDENSAADMSEFTRHLSRIAKECGSSLVFCHHHSKGGQGAKRSMDRASGSSVFARDPDAIIDMLPLECERARQKACRLAQCEAISRYANKNSDIDWDMSLDPTDMDDPDKVYTAACDMTRADLKDGLREAREKAAAMFGESATGWRISFTLREFASPRPIESWFSYPCHTTEHADLLRDCVAEGDEQPRQTYRKPAAQKAPRLTKPEQLRQAVETDPGHMWTVRELSEKFGWKEKTTINQARELGYSVKHGVVLAKKEDGK